MSIFVGRTGTRPLNIFRLATEDLRSTRRRSLVAIFLGVWLAGLVSVRPCVASRFDQALRYIQQGRPESAVILLREVLRESPNDVKAQNLMGIALTASGKLQEGNYHFRKAIKIDPKFYPALKNLALNEFTLNRVDDAETHLEQFLKFSPNDPAAHLALGEIFFRKEQFPAAVDHYLKSQGLFLRSAPTVLNYARSCFESGQGDKAAGALELLRPEADSRAHFQAGAMLARLGKYEAASRQFELARKGYPDPYDAGFNLTLAYVKSQNYPAAIRTAQDLISQGFKKAELYNLLAEAYEQSGRTIEAYNALRTATQVEPLDENNYLDLIALGVDHSNFDLALDIANIGLRNIPNSYRLLLQRGSVQAFRGHLKEATEDLEAASRIDPQKNLPFFAMVMAMMQMDKFDEAEEVLRQRLARSPGDYLLLYALGEAMNRKGASPATAQGAEALRALEESVRLNPNFADSRVALGRALLKRGEIDRTIQELEKALELDPTNFSPAYQLAAAYRRKGDTKRADELLAKFEKFKTEEAAKYSNRTLLRLLREGEK